jgi:hypothetical protein
MQCISQPCCFVRNKICSEKILTRDSGDYFTMKYTSIPRAEVFFQTIRVEKDILNLFGFRSQGFSGQNKNVNKESNLPCLSKFRSQEMRTN